MIEKKRKREGTNYLLNTFVLPALRKKRAEAKGQFISPVAADAKCIYPVEYKVRSRR
jgi:hypothetical protein